MISPTDLLKKIKRRLGVRVLKLSLTDEELLDIITGETLDTFSIYVPYVFKDFITKKDRVPGTVNSYFLDDCLKRHHDVQCIGIYDVNLGDGTSLREAAMLGIYEGSSVPVPRHSQYLGGFSLENAMLSGALADITSAFEFAREVFFFEAPNRITITRHEVDDIAQVTFQAKHPKDLSTIAITYEEEFFKLAMLNIKIALYNEMKYYNEMDTTFGGARLMIDEWSSAEENRESLLKEWDDKYIIERGDAIFVI